MDMSNVNTAQKSSSDQTTVRKCNRYMIKIEIGNEKFNIFYGGGCGDLVSMRDGVFRSEELGLATQERPGQTKLIKFIKLRK